MAINLKKVFNACCCKDLFCKAWRKKKEFKPENAIPDVKHGGGNVYCDMSLFFIIWFRMTWLCVIEGRMNVPRYIEQNPLYISQGFKNEVQSGLSTILNILAKKQNGLKIRKQHIEVVLSVLQLKPDWKFMSIIVNLVIWRNLLVSSNY